jgi:DNA segregation ATPase FtsK/SpoIIIE, S-DNA-T family
MSFAGSTQRMPGVGQEAPAPVELADRWHSFARRVRWWVGTFSHLRTVVVVALVVTVIGRQFGRVGAVVVVVTLCGLLANPGGGRVITRELRRLLGLWWRYRWSSNASRVGLGSDGESSSFEPPELRRLTVDPLGRTYRLRVARLKLAEVEASAERLRGKWRAHHVLVTVPKPGYVDLRVLRRDPIGHTIAYRSGRPVATLQDGSPFDWPVGGGHALIAGSTGSGKSGVLAAIVASFADRDDVALLAIDLKRVEVAALRPRCSKVATDLVGTYGLLSWLVETMEDRWSIMEAEGVRTWQASASRPWLVLIVDEFAAIAAVDALHPDQKQAAKDAANRLGLVDALASRGRAAGVELILCTQSPAADLFGKTAIRSNLPRRAVARVVSADQSFVGLGVHGGGAESIDAARPGTVRLIVPGLDGIATARFAYLPDGAVEAMAQRTAHLAPMLDASPIEDHTQHEPAPAAPSNPPATASNAPPSHNERSEAGATEPPRAQTHAVGWSPFSCAAGDERPAQKAGTPHPRNPYRGRGAAPSDPEASDSRGATPPPKPGYRPTDPAAGDEPGFVPALASADTPTFARGESERLPSGAPRTPDSGTPGPHRAPLTGNDHGSTCSPDVLIIPHADERRRNPATGRPFPASYRKRWSDGTLRNYPETA